MNPISPYSLPSNFKHIYNGIFTEDPMIIGERIIRPKTPFNPCNVQHHIDHFNHRSLPSISQTYSPNSCAN